MQCHINVLNFGQRTLVKDVDPKSSTTQQLGSQVRTLIGEQLRVLEDRLKTEILPQASAVTWRWLGDGNVWCHDWFHLMHLLAILAVCFVFNESIYMIFQAPKNLIVDFSWVPVFCLLQGFSWISFGCWTELKPAVGGHFKVASRTPRQVGSGSRGVTAATGFCCCCCCCCFCRHFSYNDMYIYIYIYIYIN